MSVKPVNGCQACLPQFEQCPIEAKQVVITACFHIYCFECLKNWVKELEKPCPLCRSTIQQKFSAKDFPVMWKIFTKILRINPDFVFEKLKKEELPETCSTCLSEFPDLRIQFDKNKNIFHKLGCQELKEDLNKITVKDIINIIRSYKDYDSELKNKLTPPLPSLFERIKNYLWTTSH